MKMKNRGFTLIELLVVVGIIILLMGSSILALSNYTDRRKALSDARLVVDHLRAVRIKATAVEVPAVCINGVANYTVTFSGPTIMTTANCSGGGSEVGPAVVLGNSSFKVLPTLVFVVGDGGIGNVQTVSICGNGFGYSVDVAAGGMVAQPRSDDAVCSL